MILTTLTGFGNEVRKLIVERVRARLKPKAAALARAAAPGRAAPELLGDGFDVPIFPSLNFANAATDISLIGTPCAGDECKDAFFEHHAATYYGLMKAQLSQR
jgi:hypothetical protein